MGWWVQKTVILIEKKNIIILVQSIIPFFSRFSRLMFSQEIPFPCVCVCVCMWSILYPYDINRIVLVLIINCHKNKKKLQRDCPCLFRGADKRCTDESSNTNNDPHSWHPFPENIESVWVEGRQYKPPYCIFFSNMLRRT